MPLDYDPSPVNPLPPVVWALFFSIFGVECMFALGEAGIIGGPGAIGWRLAAIRDYGFSGEAFDFMLSNGILLGEHLVRFVSYAFVHQGFTSALLSGVILLAMGKLIGEVMGQLAVVVMFFGCAVFGALAFGLLTDEAWMIGAYPAVYGMIGGYTYLIWQHLAGTGLRQLNAFRLIGVLMGIQLLFGILFTVGYGWIADLAGFVFGFAVSPVLVRGGIAHLLEKLRTR
ncbi:MAG: rhomboid family intramembrane serine protease [Rhodobacteraceae bacterium]|nr:rhomboid family intramembrane serine protease [Paracoccaceae bacterium]